jgi:hypothetical protein
MVQEHMKQMLANVHVRLLAHGNLYKDVYFFATLKIAPLTLCSQEAIRIAELIESGLGLSTVPQSELDERCLLLPSGGLLDPILESSLTQIKVRIIYGPLMSQILNNLTLR